MGATMDNISLYKFHLLISQLQKMLSKDISKGVIKITHIPKSRIHYIEENLKDGKPAIIIN